MKTPIKFTKFVFIIFTIICLFSFRITEAKPAALNKQANTSQVNTLLNEFYNIKTKNPKQAETILQKILSIDPKNRNVQLEMGYLLLSQKREAESLIYFQKASALDPNDFQTIMQIAYSLNSLGRNKEAYYEFKKATKSPDKKIQEIAEQSMKNLAGSVSTPTAKQKKSNTIDDQVNTLLNEFYKIKTKNPKQAETILQKILSIAPNNRNILLEMAYLLLGQKREAESLIYFQKASALDPHDYQTIMQIAYSLNNLDRNREAYYEFEKATKAPDKKIRETAEESMVNLAGSQTRIFSKPFFADLYASPYYYSRFKDLIFPAQFRFGVAYGKNDALQIYTIVYFNKDTNSAAVNGIPLIYSENAVLTSLGIRYQPFEKIPFYGYIEYGEAYNMLPLPGQGPWTDDLRTGIAGYVDWGVKQAYASELEFLFKHRGDFYANVSYYSRYLHDIIAQLQLREGARVARYHNSSLDLYMVVRNFLDNKGFYYNNILEVGPGFAFTPNNRFNLVFRVEVVKGYYLPFNNATSIPPYRHYYNALIEVETYMKF